MKRLKNRITSEKNYIINKLYYYICFFFLYRIRHVKETISKYIDSNMIMRNFDSRAVTIIWFNRMNNVPLLF